MDPSHTIETTDEIWEAILGQPAIGALFIGGHRWGGRTVRWCASGTEMPGRRSTSSPRLGMRKVTKNFPPIWRTLQRNTMAVNPTAIPIQRSKTLRDFEFMNPEGTRTFCKVHRMVPRKGGGQLFEEVPAEVEITGFDYGLLLVKAKRIPCGEAMLLHVGRFE